MSFEEKRDAAGYSLFGSLHLSATNIDNFGCFQAGADWAKQELEESLERTNKALDHPCRGTCSGWQQGYDRAKKELGTRTQELEKFVDECAIGPFFDSNQSSLIEWMVSRAKSLQATREADGSSAGEK